jgi:hypothetical protein
MDLLHSSTNMLDKFFSIENHGKENFKKWTYLIHAPIPSILSNIFTRLLISECNFATDLRRHISAASILVFPIIVQTSDQYEGTGLGIVLHSFEYP